MIIRPGPCFADAQLDSLLAAPSKRPPVALRPQSGRFPPGRHSSVSRLVTSGAIRNSLPVFALRSNALGGDCAPARPVLWRVAGRGSGIDGTDSALTGDEATCTFRFFWFL